MVVTPNLFLNLFSILVHCPVAIPIATTNSCLGCFWGKLTLGSLGSLGKWFLVWKLVWLH